MTFQLLIIFTDGFIQGPYHIQSQLHKKIHETKWQNKICFQQFYFTVKNMFESQLNYKKKSKSQFVKNITFFLAICLYYYYNIIRCD